ncbi:MAG: VWA domain-containing protein [Bryobacterales bacterium]|nr:VWA domain-containing protein [Bryobacterales bacterium]
MLLAQDAAKVPQKQPQPAAAGQELSDADIIRMNVTRVNLLYTVVDKRGRFVTDLVKEDFEVFEGKKQQTISDFTAESDLPLRLAIVIDTSNSIRDRFRFQQEAALEFLRSAMRRERDKAIVVGFDMLPNLATDLTDDMGKLENAVRDLRPGGGTSLYDAIAFASRDKLSQDQPRHKFRRAIVLLSDGDDNNSKYTRDQALEMAQKADVVIYTISTNISRTESDGDKVLKYYAQETGGLAFFPFKVEDLAQSFENIANEMRHQYSAAFNPVPLKADGLFHEITMKVKSRKDLIVRARKGYYAPKLP